MTEGGPDVKRVQLDCNADLASVRQARAFVSTTLADWHLEGVSHAVEVCASELVANAVVHARSRLCVTLVLLTDELRMEVEDHSRRVPVVGSRDVYREHGRGLMLLESLATGWGHYPTATGKVVWFTLDLPRSAGPGSGPPNRCSRYGLDP